MGISGEAGLARLAWAGIRALGLWGRVGSGGYIVIAEFGMKGLHFLHADIVGPCNLSSCIEVGGWR